MDIVIQIQIKQPGGQINVTNKLKLTYSIGNKKKKKKKKKHAAATSSITSVQCGSPSSFIH